MPQASDFHTSLIPHPTHVFFRHVRRQGLPIMLACCAVAGVQAVELGDIRVHSSAGRQLRASVPLAGADAQEVEGRCFSGVVLNAKREPEGTLKVTVQRSGAGAVLLMAGTHAPGEGSATIAVENVCGTGAGREYAVTLEAAPAAMAASAAAQVPVPSDVNAAPLQASASAEAAGKAKHDAPAATLQKALAQEDALSRKLQSLETKMGAVLAAPDAIQLLGGKAPDVRKPMDIGSTSPLILKLERSLVFVDFLATQQEVATWTESEIGALLLLLLACTAAGIFVHLRKAEQPARWMPGDLAS